MWILLAVIALVANFLYWTRDYFRYTIYRFRGVIPPGPPALPIVGTWSLDTDAPWETCTKWAKDYGKLFTYFLGPELQLVVADGELARTVLKDARFEGRPVTNLSRIFNNLGLAFASGNMWKDTRRFEIMALRDFGRGLETNLLEEYVHQNARELLEEIEETHRSPFYSRASMQRYVGKCIASILCGQSLKFDDPRFDRLNDNVGVILGPSTTPSNILNVLPWLSAIPPFSHNQAVLVQRMEEMVEMIRDMVEEHKKSFDLENIRDSIDVYLKEQRQPGTDLNSFTDDQLVYMGVEMYAAGLDNTMAALQWWVLLIASHPEVQQRCHREIKDNLPNGCFPAYSERGKLPYCEAMMNEVMRIATVDPFGLPHRCLEDTKIGRFLIPRDTTVMMDYFGIHYSPENFPDPWEFRPERFLNEAGKYISSPNNLSFSIGRRMCSGDNLAKTMIFIGIISIMQRYWLVRTENRPWTEVKRINGVGERNGRTLPFSALKSN